MGFDLKSFATDKTLEVEGVWEDLGEGAAILVARLGNPEYLKRFKKIPRGLRRMIENDTLGDNSVAAIIVELMAGTILLDWKGLTDAGKSIKYSTEEAKVYLTKYPDFREFVWSIAGEAQRFHEESVEADAKNSKSVSSGS